MAEAIKTTKNDVDVSLPNEWSFWYSPRGRNSLPDAKTNYEANITHLGDVATVKEFLSFYCYLKKPSDVPVDNKMVVFRKGSLPCWEKWPKGGCWILQVKKKTDAHSYNKKWEKLLFACIAEEFGDDNVAGIVLSVRQKKNLIEIWLKNSQDETDRIKIGEKIRELLELEPTNLVFYFKEHQKSLKEGSTLRGVEHYSFISTPVETPLGTPLQNLSKPPEEIPELDFEL